MNWNNWCRYGKGMFAKCRRHKFVPPQGGSLHKFIIKWRQQLVLGVDASSMDPSLLISKTALL